MDNVVSPLNSLHIACQRKHFPDWGQELLDRVKDGRLLCNARKNDMILRILRVLVKC